MKSRIFLLLFLGVFTNACQNSEPDQQTSLPDEKNDILSVEEKKPKKIIFFGDSLTAAYGLDPGEGFPAIIQKKLDDKDLHYQVVNAGLSGETTAGGKERVEWILQQDVDIFVLALGGNDGLRGFPAETTYSNLQSIINKVEEKAPEALIILAGMEAPPNMGQEYTTEFRNIFPRLAKENHLALVPFLLENVGGIPELNLPDGIHPNPKGQKIVAENVWAILENLL